MPSKRTSRPKKSNDALAMLKADHDKVKKMFKEFERMTEDEEMGEEAQQLATQICNELKVHTTLEEEIFYPEARAALEDDEDLLDEAEVEHASAKDLIEQIEAGGGDEKFAAKVTVLGEYVNHHIKEEQDEMFPKVKKAKELDLGEMGERMMARKQELMQEMGMAEEGEEAEGEEGEEGQAGRRRGGSRSSHASR